MGCPSRTRLEEGRTLPYYDLVGSMFSSQYIYTSTWDSHIYHITISWIFFYFCYLYIHSIVLIYILIVLFHRLPLSKKEWEGKLSFPKGEPK